MPGILGCPFTKEENDKSKYDAAANDILSDEHNVLVKRLLTFENGVEKYVNVIDAMKSKDCKLICDKHNIGNETDCHCRSIEAFMKCDEAREKWMNKYVRNTVNVISSSSRAQDQGACDRNVLNNGDVDSCYLVEVMTNDDGVIYPWNVCSDVVERAGDTGVAIVNDDNMVFNVVKRVCDENDSEHVSKHVVGEQTCLCNSRCQIGNYCGLLQQQE